jgi:lactate 2-monooxygenase
MLAWRPRDLAGAYLPFLKGVGNQQYFSDPVFLAGLEKPRRRICGRRSASGCINHPADARLAIDGGRRAGRAAEGRRRGRGRPAGVVRQRDPRRVGHREGGGARRSGGLIGRPFVWGLAVGGEDGVRQVLQSLLAELDLTLALSGCCSPEELVVERV